MLEYFTFGLLSDKQYMIWSQLVINYFNEYVVWMKFFKFNVAFNTNSAPSVLNWIFCSVFLNTSLWFSNLLEIILCILIGLLLITPEYIALHRFWLQN